MAHSPALQPLLAIVLHYHERWDGFGYPAGLKGTQIPLLARIVAATDVWDALCSARPYRPAWSVESAVAFVAQAAGTQFDPEVVAAFLPEIGSGAAVAPAAGMHQLAGPANAADLGVVLCGLPF